MIVLKDFQRCYAASVRFDRYRRTVAIGAADHQHMIATQPVITSEDIGRQISAGKVPDMQVAIGVRPSHRYMNILC